MSHRPASLAALVLLAAAALGPAPAMASASGPEFCFTNASYRMVVVQVRFDYRKIGETGHQTEWRTLYNGSSHCKHFGQVNRLRFETRYHDGIGWNNGCNVSADPSRSATYVLEGSSLNPSCRLQQ